LDKLFTHEIMHLSPSSITWQTKQVKMKKIWLAESIQLMAAHHRVYECHLHADC